MEKLRRVLSGQDDEEQGLTAQVTSPAAATVGGGREPPSENRPRLLCSGLSLGPSHLHPCSADPAASSEAQALGLGCLWPPRAFQVSDINLKLHRAKGCL